MEFPMRLNRYLSSCGLGSRRGCEALITEGRVKINDQVSVNLGTKVSAGDKVVIAGKGAESTLVTSIALPESDEKAMPPEGKGDRVAKADQDLIKKWIDGGADFGAWKGGAK